MATNVIAPCYENCIIQIYLDCYGLQHVTNQGETTNVFGVSYFQTTQRHSNSKLLENVKYSSFQYVRFVISNGAVFCYHRHN